MMLMVKDRKEKMVVDVEAEVAERRKCTRRPLHGVVSFACGQGAGSSNIWYLGWIQDASVAGMRISVNQSVTVGVGESVTVLCLPGGEQKSHGREPVQIRAEVVWQSEDGLQFGLRYR
jgi:hypothetical protein